VIAPDPENCDGRAAAPSGLTLEQERLVWATVERCLGLIADAIGGEPRSALLSMVIGHHIHATVLGVVAEEASPASRERLAQDAAEAIARAVRKAAP
jgi:hypothetical protein